MARAASKVRVEASRTSKTTGGLSVGDQASDVALTTDEGKPVRLADFRGKKIVFYF